MVATKISSFLHISCFHLDEYLSSIQDPSLIFLSDETDMWRFTSEEICSRLIQAGAYASPYVEKLLQERSQNETGRIIEGERIDPSFVENAIKAKKAIGIFIIEEDPEQLYRTLQHRSIRFSQLKEDRKRKVVNMDCLLGRWLRMEAETRRIPWILSQPWSTLANRTLEQIMKATP